jgi:integrase
LIHLPTVVIKPLAEHLLRYPPLRDQKDERFNGLVFFGEHGRPVRRHTFRKIWDRACAEAGISGVRPGWLRHTGVSVAYAASHDLKAVSQRLGRTSVRMVDETYVRLYDDAARELADAIDALVARSANAEGES